MVVVNLRPREDTEYGTAPDGREGTVNPDTGGLLILNDDNSIDELPEEEWRPAKRAGNGKHFANLVDVLDQNEVARIGDEVWRGVTADIASRREYMEMTAEAIRMLGLRLEPPRSDAGGSGAPLEGMSTVRHPLLLEACLGFQSDFRGEMLPADGPVKVRNDATAPSGVPEEVVRFAVQAMATAGVIAPENVDTAVQAVMAANEAGMGHNGGPALDMGDELAADLEKDLNHFLTNTATEYYPDTDQMAFVVGLLGCAFKKVFNCPLRRRPVSESISSKDLIVDAGVTDTANAPRVTHEMEKLKDDILKLMEAGVYAEGRISQPLYVQNPVQEAVAEAQGYDRSAQRPEDKPHTVWECYTKLNIRGLDDGAPGNGGGFTDDGEIRVPRPYKVSMDRDSRQVFEIRRDWMPGDKDFAARRTFVKYSFAPVLSFYGIGLMHILGNTTMALTAGWRLMLDSMMFSNFPGFLYVDVLGKQLTNIFRVAPGAGVPIQTGGQPIGNMISPLPYKGPQPAGLSLLDNVAQAAARVGSRPNVPTGEGVQNAPVGTVMANIIEATKLTGAVFKRLHAAQAEEFGLIAERLREDPEAFWRHNKKPARQWDEATLLAALDDYDLVPAADPNTPSMLHRVMQRMAVFQMALQTPPGVFKVVPTAEWVLRGMGVTSTDSLLNTQEEFEAFQAQQAAAAGGAGAKPPDPQATQAKMMQAQASIATAQARAKEADAKVPLLGAQTQKTAAEGSAVGADQQLRAHEAMVESQDRAADRAAKTEIDMTREQTERLRLQHEMVAHADDHAVAAAGLATRPQPGGGP
jgi:hypothetical protein